MVGGQRRRFEEQTLASAASHERCWNPPLRHYASTSFKPTEPEIAAVYARNIPLDSYFSAKVGQPFMATFHLIEVGTRHVPLSQL